MNLFEKLNRLDDSLVESKKMLTESSEKTKIEVKFEPYTRYGYKPITTARVSGKDLLHALLRMTDKMRLYINSDYAAEYEEDYGVKLTAEALLERIEEQNGDGCDFIFYIKNLTTGEMLFDSGYEESEDWDDDIDEMLIENASEDDTLKRIIANNDLARVDTEKLIDYRIRSAAKTGKCPICGGDLTNMVCDNCKNSYRQNGNNGTSYTLIDAALLRSIQKVDPSFNSLSLDEKVEYLYNSFFLGEGETASRNISGNQIEKDAQRKNKINKVVGNPTYNTSGDNVRKTKQYIKQQLLQAAKFEDENTNALQKIKPEDYIKNNIVRKN